MYPEAGGSSIVRPPRLQRVLVLLRRVGPDAQLRHHDRHLGVLRAALPRRAVLGRRCATRPGDIIVRHRRDHRRPRGDQRPRRRGVGAASTSCSPSSTSPPSCCWSLAGIVPRLLARHAGRQRRTSASRRPGRTSSSRSRSAMIAYTGIETISNMAEEAKDEAKTIPAAINRVVHRRLRDLLRRCRRSRSRRCRSRRTHDRRVLRRCSACAEEQGGFAGDPVLGVVKHLDLGPLQGAGRGLRRPARGDDPVHRDQRRASSASRGSSTRWACTARCPTGCASCTRSYGTPWIGILVFGAIACLTLIPGQADFLGNMYAFGAMLSFTIAHLAVIRLRFSRARPRAARTAGPGILRIARPRPAAVRGPRRARHGVWRSSS